MLRGIVRKFSNLSAEEVKQMPWNDLEKYVTSLFKMNLTGDYMILKKKLLPIRIIVYINKKLLSSQVSTH